MHIFWFICIFLWKFSLFKLQTSACTLKGLNSTFNIIISNSKGCEIYVHIFFFLTCFQFCFLHRGFVFKKSSLLPCILFGQYISPLPWDQSRSYLGLYLGEVGVGFYLVWSSFLGSPTWHLMFVVGLRFFNIGICLATKTSITVH